MVHRGDVFLNGVVTRVTPLTRPNIAEGIHRVVPKEIQYLLRTQDQELKRGQVQVGRHDKSKKSNDTAFCDSG